MILRKRSLFCTLILLVAAVFAELFISAGLTHAQSFRIAVSTSYNLPMYNPPVWWAGDCDSGHNSQANPTPMAIWNGIEACKPLPGKSNLVPVSFFSGWSQENEFQCTELVKRYLYLAYGLKSLGGTNGSQVVANYTNTYGILHKMLNDGSASLKPMPGDVLSYGATNTFGHTSIVIGVNSDGSINVLQQNIVWSGAFVPIETLKVVNNIIQPSPHGAGSVSSWMTTRSTASSTTLNFSVTMPNIGPNGGGNTNPLHPTRPATIVVLSASNAVVETLSANVTYSQGIYRGSVNLGSLSSGSYQAKVRLSNTLYKMLSGFFTTPVATWSPATIALVSGDLNGDNQINTTDYNILMSCYGSKVCSNKSDSDLDENGVVDGVDYNIWLRNSQTQHGA